MCESYHISRTRVARVARVTGPSGPGTSPNDSTNNIIITNLRSVLFPSEHELHEMHELQESRNRGHQPSIRWKRHASLHKMPHKFAKYIISSEHELQEPRGRGTSTNDSMKIKYIANLRSISSSSNRLVGVATSRVLKSGLFLTCAWPFFFSGHHRLR